MPKPTKPMDDKEKQRLILQLKKDTGCTLRKCAAMLEACGWDYDKANPPKVVDLFAEPEQPAPKASAGAEHPAKDKPRSSDKPGKPAKDKPKDSPNASQTPRTSANQGHSAKDKQTPAKPKKADKQPANAQKQAPEEPKPKADDYSDFQWYLQRCQQQARDNGASAKPVQIAKGYYTMYEIANYAKSLGLSVQNQKD